MEFRRLRSAVVDRDLDRDVVRLDQVLEGLGALVGGRVRLWRFDGRTLRLSAGPDPGWSPSLPDVAGRMNTPDLPEWSGLPK